MPRYIFLLVCLLSFVMGVFAQEATESAEERSAHQVPGWLATYTDEGGTALVNPETGEEVSTYAAFLEFDGSLISVWPNADYIYTGNPEEGYTGQFLVSDPDISVTTTLEFVDEDTRTEIRSTSMFGTEQESYITYTRTENDIEIWSETTRDFVEITMLTSCLGRPSAELSFGWVAPDLLMPFRFEDDGTVLMDYRTYIGGEHEDISTRSTVDGGSTTTVIVRSIDVGTGSIGFRLHGTIDDRDDCEMIYESSFSPFDADYDNILALAEEISAEFERE